MSAGDIGGAADQAYGAFVLVAGLLLLGLVADADGLFGWASAKLLGVTRAPGRLLVVALALVAAVTAVLNLDTAVVFLTPILIGAARGAGVDEQPFLYGSVLMANASSLERWGAGGGIRRADAPPPGAPRVRPLGAAACALAAALVLALPAPGLPVLGIALVATAVRVRDGTLGMRAAAEAVGPAALVGLFALSVALGTLGRAWSGPADLLGSASPAQTCAVAALAAILMNNLPAAVLLSAQPPPHPRALLLGLNAGPNLAVTGSLSAYLWWRAARGCGARPSARRFSALGAPLAVAAMAAGLGTIALIGPS